MAMEFDRHEPYMDRALSLAQQALKRGDWPVAAILVADGQVLAEGQGRQRTSTDPTWHAEIEAIRHAAASGADLSRATLYCTMEPCPMCAWAMRLSGIQRVVLGARHADLQRVDLGHYSLERFAELMGYPLDLVEGVRRDECVALRQRWGKDLVRDRE
jgi:tRNA(adenine34) deaminase